MRPDENPDRPQGPPLTSTGVSTSKVVVRMVPTKFRFTRTHKITGEIRSDLGPYLLINTVPIPLKSGYGVALPAIILRAEIHHRRDPYEFPPMTATDDSIYHGGDLEDEIAIAQRRCTKAPLSTSYVRALATIQRNSESGIRQIR
jgi:hypothetical protein